MNTLSTNCKRATYVARDSLDELAERRFARLVIGQIQLLSDRIEEVLNKKDNLSQQEYTTRLETPIADFKDWANAVLHRFTTTRSPYAFADSPVTTLLRDTMEFISQGEWFTREQWYRDEFPNRISNSLAAFSLLASATLQQQGAYSISEFQLTQLSESMRSELSKVCQARMIATGIRKPQTGLEFSVTPEDVRQMVGHKGTVVFALHKEGVLVGTVLLYLDDTLLSPGGKQVMQRYIDNKGIAPERCAYVELAILDKQFARRHFSAGDKPYKNLMQVVQETCALLGITDIIGEVREGNLAIHAHRAVGFEETGYWREKMVIDSTSWLLQTTSYPKPEQQDLLAKNLQSL